MKITQTIHNDFFIVNQILFNNINFVITELNNEKESQEYGSCTFKLNKKKIIFRTSKITPTKSGQFVTLWKRNNAGLTTPFNHKDDFDFVIIFSSANDNFGIFILPKTILIEKEIISTAKKEGKRGIRVYPPWDITKSKQAEKTKAWQREYFVNSIPQTSFENSILKQLQ